MSEPVTETSPLLKVPHPFTDEQISSRNKLWQECWDELRIILRYSLPVIGTQLLEYSLVMTPVVSIGHLSTTALAAIGLGSMTANVTAFSIIHGFTSALDTMLPHAWTSSEPHLVGLWTQRMAVIMAFLQIPMFLTWWNAETILRLLGQDAQVSHLAALYLRWASLGLPAYAFNRLSRRYFYCQGFFSIPTRITCIVAPINMILNYILVWGPHQIRLGFIGAPIATALSLNLASILFIIHGVFYTPHTAWHPISRQAFTSIGMLTKLGVAGVCQVATEWWAWELVALAASMLGPVSLASQSILLVSGLTTSQIPYALSSATSVRIGNLLGAREARTALLSSRTAVVVAFAFSVATSSMFLAFRNSWAYLFSSDPEVITLVASIMPLVALYQVFDANAIVTAGILRTRGMQGVGALLNLSSYYIVGIPLGTWLTFKCGWGLGGIWSGLTISLTFNAFIGTLLCCRTNWDNEVLKAAWRLSGHAKLRQSVVDEENLVSQDVEAR